MIFLYIFEIILIFCHFSIVIKYHSRTLLSDILFIFSQNNIYPEKSFHMKIKLIRRLEKLIC